MTIPEIRFLTVLSAAVFLSGCVLRPPNPLPLTERCVDSPIPASVEQGRHLSFFHSSALPDCRDGGLRFEGYRHTQLTFGTGTYEFFDDEAQDPTLLKHAEDDWFAAIESAIANPAAEGRVVIFIHGYATDFDEAHMDAAEVRALAGNDVPIVMLHWPSRNSVGGYIVDRASIMWAQDRITNMIARILPLAEDVTLVSHSLGALAVIDAVTALDRNPAVDATKIARIVLASPDIDRHRALRPNGALDQILKHGRQALIYASRKDKPLKVSRDLNGYARLGSTNCKFDVEFERRALGTDGNCHLTEPREGLAIVDTGPSDAQGLLRHNDFLKSCQVRRDLQAFLRSEEPPAYRKSIMRDGLTGFRIDAEMDYDGAPCEPIM